MYDRIECIPSEEEIRARSYQIWEREGCPDGKAEEHWLRAEAELADECESGRIASIHFREQTFPSDEEIRARAHSIWEREGRPEGKAEVHWLKAKAELEAECYTECAAYVDGKSTNYVPPLLGISERPTRTESAMGGLTKKVEGALHVA